MPMGWWENLGVCDFERLVCKVRGLDVVSEVISVTPGRQEDGAEFLAIRVRSSQEDKSTENVATCYVRSDGSLEELRQSVRQSRERFAYQFAQELFHIAPPQPPYCLSSASNPNHPPKP